LSYRKVMARKGLLAEPWLDEIGVIPL